MSFDGLAIRKKVFLQSSHRIEKHIDVVLEVLEVQSSVNFDICLDGESIEFWRADLMFESPHATNFVDFPPSNGGALMLSGTTVVESRGFGESFLVGEDFKVCI